MHKVGFFVLHLLQQPGNPGLGLVLEVYQHLYLNIVLPVYHRLAVPLLPLVKPVIGLLLLVLLILGVLHHVLGELSSSSFIPFGKIQYFTEFPLECKSQSQRLGHPIVFLFLSGHLLLLPLLLPPVHAAAWRPEG